MALFHCEEILTAAWTHAPGRWDTSDGCVPVRVVWATFRALEMARARRALDLARGIGLALGGGEEGAAAHRLAVAFDEAFPVGRRE